MVALLTSKLRSLFTVAAPAEDATHTTIERLGDKRSDTMGQTDRRTDAETIHQLAKVGTLVS